MRKSLLLALMIASLAVGAHTNSTVDDCKSRFEYVVDSELVTLMPSTAFYFFDKSDGDVVEWMWDFGDGETSIEKNTYHIYVHPVFPDGALVKINPYRTVSLTIVTSGGCKSTFSETIDIYNVPGQGSTCKSDFYFYQTGFDQDAQTATFKFVNMGWGQSDSYSWNFSDGLVSNEHEPEMTFDFSRTERKVCLTVTGDDDCSDELCQTVYIDTTGQGPDTTKVGCYVTFGYSINYDYNTFAPALVLDFYSKPDHPVKEYHWDFGDGNFSDEANPTHIFNYPLNVDSLSDDTDHIRTVCLTITTVDGCESSWCEVIDIYTGTYPEDNCGAWFKYYVPEDVITIPEVVPYKLFPTNDAAVSWLWTFQDGTTSTEREPLVTFDIFGGEQKICLTTTNDEGCVSTLCEIIWLSPWIIDTTYTETECSKYKFRYDSFYPQWASACIGTVTAQVVDGANAVDVEYYYWTSETGDIFIDGPLLTNMCPTQTYTVTALTADGCKFSASILFNSDGTVVEVKRDPIIWWISGWGDDSYIEYEVGDGSYTVEWLLCDGSVYDGLNVPLQKINCGNSQPNLILKDAAGNVIYSENIALRTSNTSVDGIKKMVLYPNPVANNLTLQIGDFENSDLHFEISNSIGQILIKNNISALQAGHRHTIDVSSFGKGVYFGKLMSGNKVLEAQKFIK
jgi:PKD repeat protein